MTEAEVLPPTVADESSVELAMWLGRRQAFGLTASRCSAADVECMRAIRDRKLYKSKAADWPEFCERYFGMSKAYANRLIQHLEVLGPNYFHISQMMRISAESYRAIAGAVREDGIEFGGEKIPIHPEHSERIVEAVSGLLKVSEEARQKPKAAAAKRKCDAPQAPPTPQQRLGRMRMQLDGFASEYSAIAREKLDHSDRVLLTALVDESRKLLAELIHGHR